MSSNEITPEITPEMKKEILREYRRKYYKPLTKQQREKYKESQARATKKYVEKNKAVCNQRCINQYYRRKQANGLLQMPFQKLKNFDLLYLFAV